MGGSNIAMDADAKKTALRMIPYGIYVLTAKAADGTLAAATVNWVTQTAFEPPLVAVGVKHNSGAYGVLKDSRAFTLNMLGKGQQGAAFAFFKATEHNGATLNGHGFTAGANGAPILDDALASVECRVVEVIEHGDHHVVLGEVTAAQVATEPSGRPDAAILEMKDLGENIFYGG
ncbi:MAG: flavin reductase family protein [Alphaproteobacteria bacterium]